MYVYVEKKRKNETPHSLESNSSLLIITSPNVCTYVYVKNFVKKIAKSTWSNQTCN